MLTHKEIEAREIVEAYLRGKLAEDDRLLFEEHFFTCEECFTEVRTAEQFINGVREAGKDGLLGAERVQPEGKGWWQPALGLAWAMASLVLLVATGWLGFVERPQTYRELDRHRALLEAERTQRRQLETQLAMAHPPAAEGNLPLAMLEARRAGAPNEVRMPPGASQLVLWIELDAGIHFSSYRLEIRDQAGSTIETISGLTKNAQGALTAGLPATRLAAATYTVLLHGAGSGQDALIAEYRLAINR